MRLPSENPAPTALNPYGFAVVIVILLFLLRFAAISEPFRIRWTQMASHPNVNCSIANPLESRRFSDTLKGVMRALHSIVMFTAFPLTIAFCAAGCWYAIHNGRDYSATFSLLLLGVLAFYVFLEAYFPYRAEWEMTLGSFLQRDAKFLIVNTVVQELGKIAIGWLSIRLAAASHGPLNHASPLLALPLLFLAFEFLQYWYHRWSHTLRGRVGTFLWRVHAAHHLPDRLYVMIHAVGHPLELLVTNVVLMLGLPFALGCSPEVTFLFLVFVNTIGLVSHLNVDLRLGWLNYLFVGPESHRFHHSTDTREAGNYAAVLPLVDILFGTFRYRPGAHPQSIGVTNPETYPASTHVTQVLAFPFDRMQPATGFAAESPDDMRKSNVS